MHDAVLAQRRRDALALDRAERGERHRLGGGVGHSVDHGEHVLVVDRDHSREGEPLAVGVGEGHRLAGCEHRALRQGPDGLRARQAGDVRAGPAHVGEPGVLRALGAQQFDGGRVLVQRLAVFHEVEIVDPGALQRQRALQRRRGDRHPGRGGHRGVARDGLRRGGRGGAIDRSRRGGGRLAGALLRLALGLRVDHEHLVDQEQEGRAHEEDDRVAGVVVSHERGRRFPSEEEGAGPSRIWEPARSAASLNSALFTSSSKRTQGRFSTPPRAMIT